MATKSGIGVVKNGLVFAYDMHNPKSWKGAPVTNMVPETSSLPTIGNSWGTYNTNQYNSNTYWNWGTVSSVSGNVITFSSTSRTVYSYDVIRPQTSGGGLTAGTNYIVRKLSNTQFTLHAYNGDQDGSEGYKVHDNVNNDSRVAISASGFPTMWWGAPHVPNAGLVKEIITDGFKHKGRTHDCIRLNYGHRGAGGGLDGMAYGGSVPQTVGGTTYTMSWYRRAVDEDAVGADPSFSMHTTGGWSLSRTVGSSLTMDWKKVVYTGSPPGTGGTNFYWWANGVKSYEMSEIMMTENSYPSEYIIGTRSNTECIIDLTGNETVTLNGADYQNDGTLKFASSSTGANVSGIDSIKGNITLMGWVDQATANGAHSTIICTSEAYQRGMKLMSHYHSAGPTMWIGNVAGNGSYLVSHGTSIDNAGPMHIAATRDTVTGYVKLYVNGVLSKNTSTGITGDIASSGSGAIGREYHSGGYGANSTIYTASVYNRILTDEEIKQCFDATKSQHI
jgi:hypothetical protein